ncbi:MAG: ABC transporter ATP-binding protein [Candidatus Hydrogenedentes bacterium]|nr:ABC transporter ATP-binding protein [Candidatus Hydrogenedentota bacterium]
MNGEAAIRVEGIGKRYRLGQTLDWGRSIRRAFGNPPADASGEIWALREVSFEVPRGTVLGIIGRNGAGKSTLLKILTRVTEPTTGRAELRGRVGSLLEVGTGFNPELTGLENIYLNGAILGMRKAEIGRKLEEIVEFSGVRAFLETPVKRYSSGMFVRLAFAVAAHLDPEILLIDEVLAVGDASFQRRCLGKMDEVAKGGRTILFVSHNMGAIRRLCPQCLWLDGGRVAAMGNTEDVIAQYFDAVNSDSPPLDPDAGRGGLRITRVAVLDAQGAPCQFFEPGDDVTIRIHYEASQRIVRPQLNLSVSGAHGLLFGANMVLDDLRPEGLEGSGVIECTFQKIPLLPQTYTLALAVYDEIGEDYVSPPIHNAASFQVQGDAGKLKYTGAMADKYVENVYTIRIPYQWRFPDGTIRTPRWAEEGHP